MLFKTLASRLAIVQATVTLVALATVAAGTLLTVNWLITRQLQDELLGSISRLGTAFEEVSEPAAHPEWLAYEADEQLLAGARLEVHGPNGEQLAAVGRPLNLPLHVDGCRREGALRVCGQQLQGLQIVTGIDETNAYPVYRYLVLALIGLTVLAGVAVTALGRSIARRSLQPLNALAGRIAAIEPGDGQRVMNGACLAELQACVVRFDSLLDRFDETLTRERRFVALASHELRTPLTLARAEIEALCEGSERDLNIRRSIRAIDQLTELVDALLWFAKAQERLEPSHLDVVNLADLTRAEIASTARGSAIGSQLPEEALVLGDERLLTRVVANLLDNACKYGGGAPVEVSLERAAEQLELRVSNAGHVAVEDTERLFEPFYRQPGSASFAPGFGLGLAFARAVARAHGGDLTLGSAVQGQTTFCVCLPLLAWSTATASLDAGEPDSGSVQLGVA